MYPFFSVSLPSFDVPRTLCIGTVALKYIIRNQPGLATATADQFDSNLPLDGMLHVCWPFRVGVSLRISHALTFVHEDRVPIVRVPPVPFGDPLHHLQVGG